MSKKVKENPDAIGGSDGMEQAAGIEPVYLPWQGNVLPLNYACGCLFRLVYYMQVP